MGEGMWKQGGVPVTCCLSRESTYRWGWARGWGRPQSLPPLVHPPTELSSTAGPQGQGESRGSSLSIHSLPSGPSSPFPTEEQPVASWGLSFERLLQDPLGLAYFTVSLGAGLGGQMAVATMVCVAGVGNGHGRGRGWSFRLARMVFLCWLPPLALLWHLLPLLSAGTFPCLCLSFSLYAFQSGPICLALSA